MSTLVVQLAAVLRHLEDNNLPAARGELLAFTNSVDAQCGKAISRSDAESFLAAANRIRSVIGCQERHSLDSWKVIRMRAGTRAEVLSTRAKPAR